MSYQVEIRTSAQKDLAKLPPKERVRIAGKIDLLADDPRPPGCVKMAGPEGFWRIRIGAYRVIYVIRDKILTVTVIHVAHRREAYRGL